MLNRSSLPKAKFSLTIAVLSISASFLCPSRLRAACSLVNGVVIANSCAGADIGAQINNAYLALPNSFDNGSQGGGGKIIVLPGYYTFATPITFTTLHKSVLLSGQSNHSVYLAYTGTTGNCGPGNSLSCAINMQYSEGNGAGMEYITLYGPGGTTSVGVYIANVQDNYIRHSVVLGFYEGIMYRPGQFFDGLDDVYVTNNSIGIDVATAAERLNIRDCTISQNTVDGILFQTALETGIP